MNCLRLNPRLGRTNDLSSDEHAAELRQRLPALEEELHRLDLDISLLLVKRKHIVRQINRCEVALAPQKRLPPELIGKLFSLCVEGPAIVPLTKGAKDSRLTMTQICSAWRTIAFNVPKLLNDVEVDLDFIRPKSLSFVDLVATWFTRFTGSSISLSLTGSIQSH
jgi:hypothetical protein